MKNTEEMKKEKQKLAYRIKKEAERSKNEVILNENFWRISPSGSSLLVEEFNKISFLSHKKYTNHFNMNWTEVLSIYGKAEELESYIFNQYMKYYKETGKQSIVSFAESINTSYYFIEKNYDMDMLRSSIGVEKMRYTDKDYEENFKRVREIVGNVPLYAEFLSLSKMPPESYALRFGLSGIVYDEILKLYIENSDFITHKERQRVHKSNIGRTSHAGIKHSEKALEVEFKRVFDEYIETTGSNPTYKEFNRLSSFNGSIYRHRYNITFVETIEMYGYEHISAYVTEKQVVEKISKIINEKYVSQATFKWLQGNNERLLRCDGYYSRNKLIVEYDGEQHFVPVDFAGKGEEWAIENMKRTQINDAIKNKLIPQHGITLIRIAYNEPYWDEDFLRMRLIEHGIMPPNHTLVSDSQSKQSKIA